MLSRRLKGDPQLLVSALLRELDIEVIPFSAEHSAAALDAYRRYGKGVHPAGLNFGDCLTYAVASQTGEPLLYVGRDFARTDLPAVMG